MLDLALLMIAFTFPAPLEELHTLASHAAQIEALIFKRVGTIRKQHTEAHENKCLSSQKVTSVTSLKVNPKLNPKLHDLAQGRERQRNRRRQNATT